MNRSLLIYLPAPRRVIPNNCFKWLTIASKKFGPDLIAEENSLSGKVPVGLNPRVAGEINWSKCKTFPFNNYALQEELFLVAVDH